MAGHTIGGCSGLCSRIGYSQWSPLQYGCHARNGTAGMHYWWMLPVCVRCIVVVMIVPGACPRWIYTLSRRSRYPFPPFVAPGRQTCPGWRAAASVAAAFKVLGGMFIATNRMMGQANQCCYRMNWMWRLSCNTWKMSTCWYRRKCAFGENDPQILAAVIDPKRLNQRTGLSGGRY